AGRLVKAADEVLCERIAAHEEDNWNGGGRRFRRVCRVNPGRYNHCHSALNQIGGERGQSIIVTVRPAVFDGYIAPLLIPAFGEALPTPVHPLRHITGRSGAEEPNYRHCRLLRARSQRPRGRTADKRHEVAASHSITSLAAETKSGESASPRAWAVRRLMKKSKCEMALIGRSRVITPRRIRST